MAVRVDVFTPSFREAMRDYRFLADRGYPARSTVELVGDRYALSRSQRSILYRGVFSAEESSRRRGSLSPSISSGILYIDGFNVLLSVAHYLAGRTLYIATDGFLRDDGEAEGKKANTESVIRAAELACRYLRDHPRTSPVFILDSRLDSAEPAISFIREALGPVNGTACPVRALSIDDPDPFLSRVTDGLVATADSRVIDRLSVPAFDLARDILFTFHRPSIPDLSELLHLCTTPENG